MKTRILAIDDHQEILELIRKTFSGQDFDLVTTTDPHEGLDLILNRKFDVIIVDLMMPEITGNELMGVIYEREELTTTAVIVLSSRSDSLAKQTAFSLGALTYIEKPFDPIILKKQVTSISNFVSNKSQRTLEIGDLCIHLSNRAVLKDGQQINFTPTEFTVFVYMAERAGQVCPREMILNGLSHQNLEVGERVIDTHISAIRKKLKGTTIEIEAVYRQGYSLKTVS